MSISPGANPSLPVSWTPTVDAAWFERLTPTSKSDPLPGAQQVESQAGGQALVGPGDSTAAASNSSAAPNQWVVQLTPEATLLAGGVAGVQGLLAASPFQTEVICGLGLQGMVLVQAEAGADPATVQAWLSDNPYVAYSEPDSVLATSVLPDDTAFAALWGLNNTGQTGGTADADIDAPEAWDISTGSASVVVGVIDTGIDYAHPDLAANVWTNPGEVPGNGIDDDGNGLVDDVHGYDFVNGDGNPMDDNGHGTHVSGTIAAVGDNAQGVAGVNWTSSLMALKFLDSQGNGFTSAAVEALNYATMMRSLYGVDVRVVNASWGGGGYSQALRDAIQAGGNAGILFVAAAGNDGVDADVSAHYPSNYDLANIISVAATDDNDQLASFSNYGATSVDLAAPGVAIRSTLPGNTYGTYSGTSMATPHVAGVAALAWSVAPNASVEQVRSAILNGADPVASLTGKMVTGGRLNARNALDGLSLSVAASNPAAGSTVSTPPVAFTVSLTHAFAPPSVGAADFRVNGIAANRATIVDTQTIIFQFNATPVTSQGPQVMAIQAGAISRAGDGDPINAWQATFYYDALPLAVASTVPSEGGIVAAAPAEIVLNFNEPVDPLSVDVGDLLLDAGSVVGARAVDADSLAFTVTDLPREGPVTYTLSDKAIRDAHGTPGPAYVGRFTIDDPMIEQYASADVPKAISDYSTITSTLTVNESYAVADLDVRLDIAHTYDADLDVYLIAPNGTRVKLFSTVGGNGNDFAGTTLDDEAATSIAEGRPPFSGRYRPLEPLSAFDASDVIGTWTLEVSDHGGQDQGTLDGWALTVERSHELPPRILGVDPLSADGEDAWGTIDTLTVRFSKAMDAAGVNDAGSWQLLEAGSDGLFDTADDVDYPLAVSPPYAGALSATLDPGGPLSPGRYRLTAASAGLADASGAHLDGNGDGTAGDDYVTRFRLLPNDWYLSNEVPKAIPDLTTITSTLTVPDSFPIGDLDVKVDITHSYDADLDVYLIAPDGTRIELFTDVGGAGDNFSGTILDDEAATAIADGQAPFSDRYRPEQPLSVLDSLDAQGTWTLEISDDSPLDQGTLNEWSIIVERGTNVPPQILTVDGLPSDGAETWGPVSGWDVHFSEAMNAAAVNDPSHWNLVEAGGDGLFDTADDAAYTLSVTPAYAGGLTATLHPNVGRLPAGDYRFTARSGGLTDLFGTPLDGNGDGTGGDDYATRFVVLPGNRYTSVDVPKNIIDFTKITSTVTVADSFLLADVDVEVSITHTYDADLDVYLIAPNGTRVELFTDVGGSGNNFAGTVLDDEAPTAVGLGAAPFAGRYRPEGLLSVLDGFGALGTWTLEITDDSLLDQGVLNGWALILQPEPALPPKIVGHLPDALTPGPVGALQVAFSRPMNQASFSLEEDVVRFEGPQGPVTPTGFRWQDPQTLEILFAPQSAPGTYTMVLGPHVLDTAGSALDQDSDLLPGEIPGDQYTASFVVAQPLGPVAFTEIGGLDPSAGDLWYQLEAVREGVLTIEADFQVGLGNVEIALYDQSGTGPPVAISIPTYGNRRIDQQVAQGDVYYLRVSGDNADVDLCLANLVSRQGDTVTVFGTEGADQFEFQTTAARQVTINGLHYEFDSAQVTSVTFHGGAGGDSALLRGSDGAETAEMWPGRGVLTGVGYVASVDGAESISAYGGATDVAVLHADPAGADVFEAWPREARLSGDGFDNRAMSFQYARAISTRASQDTAIFHDDPAGADQFDSWPTEARLSGDGFYNRALSFRYVEATSTPGNLDVAVLRGDPNAVDTFHAWPDEATLSDISNSNFSVRATSFRYLYGLGADGNGDMAEFYDRPGVRDTFYFAPGDGRLYGDLFSNRVRSFDYVSAYATEGDGDVAFLHGDPNGKDTFQAWPDRAEISGSNSRAEYSAKAYSFDVVAALSTHGNGDMATLYDNPAAKDTFKAWPNTAKLYGTGFSNQAYSFDSVVAVATEGDGDLAVLYDDPAAKDAFNASPNQATLTGAGFSNQARSFDVIAAVATKGSGDVATLYDNPTQKDVLRAWPELARFYGAGFSNSAYSFDSVVAVGTKGNNDAAVLFDDPGAADSFEAWPTEASLSGLSGGDFLVRALSFRQVYAYATGGGQDVATLHDDPAGTDTFSAWPEEARLEGNGFSNRALSFRYVYADSTGGDDVAKLYDSEGKDSFEAWPDQAWLAGDSFYNWAGSFPHVTGYSQNGGGDVARLFDSALDDLLQARDAWARLSNASLDFANLAFGFSTIEATLSNPSDTENVDPAVDFLVTYRLWEP